MPYGIIYYSDKVQEDIARLPKTMVARYLKLADRMEVFGPDLGMPHTRALGGGLFELRLTGAEGIARVFYCLLGDRRIMMLHTFIKKTRQTPPVELATARRRKQEVCHGNP
ncbi:MAG: type II toxin-antitoxin system RelE/ParE family toxin [Candidatus Latescibacterota bacterium]